MTTNTLCLYDYYLCGCAAHLLWQKSKDKNNIMILYVVLLTVQTRLLLLPRSWALDLLNNIIKTSHNFPSYNPIAYLSVHSAVSLRISKKKLK